MSRILGGARNISVKLLELARFAPYQPAGPVRACGLIAAVYLPLLAVYYSADQSRQNVLFPAVAFTSFAMLVAGIVHNRPPKKLPWLFAAAGVFCLACGETLFSVYDAAGTVPFPSPADAWWLAGHVLLAVWVALHLRSCFSRDDRDTYVDALLLTMSCLVLVWIFVIGPNAQDPSLSVVQRALSIGYPAIDMFMVFMVITLVLGARSRSIALLLMLVAFVLEVGANTVFGYLQLNGGYESGGPIDAVWLLAYLLWGAVALHPSMRTLDRVERSPLAAIGRSRLLFMLGALLVSPALFVASSGTATTAWNVWIISGIWAIMSSLTIFRINGLVESLARALAEIRGKHDEVMVAESQLRRAVDDLHASSRVQSEFFAMAAHELRNPITSIMGFADTLVNYWHSLGETERRKFATIVHSQSTRLARLVDDMLTVSQIEAGAFAVTRTAGVLARIAEDAVAESGVKDVNLHGVPSDIVECDVGRLEQILVNLLTNADKYGKPPIELHLSVDGTNVTAVIRDHGEGVPRDFVPVMFEPFTRDRSTDSMSQSGTGLGLAIVRLLAEEQNGSIEYRQADGGGAEFELRLPQFVATAPQNS